MEQTKRPTLLAVCRLLSEHRVQYAIIGGVALQVHQREPRTTLDIDIALLDRATLPREALISNGFTFTGSFEFSDNWLSSDGTPVQFSDDPAVAGAIEAADTLELDGVSFCVLRVMDLLHQKLRAGSDPARRRSKRLQDLADAESLLEGDPGLADSLSEDERAILDSLPK